MTGNDRQRNPRFATPTPGCPICVEEHGRKGELEMSDDLERARRRDRERRADEVLKFLGVGEPVPDDYEPEESSPIDHLHYSERMLWNECPEAHDALARLGRYRAARKRVLALCEASTTGHVSVVKVVAAVHGTGTQRP